MALSIEGNDQYSFVVRGNTLPYREIFKQHGGSWRPPLKAWRFTNSKINEVTALVNGINSGQPVHANPTITPGIVPVPVPQAYPVISPSVPVPIQTPLPFISIPMENMSTVPLPAIQINKNTTNEKNYVVEYIVPKIEVNQLLNIMYKGQSIVAIVTNKDDMVLTVKPVGGTTGEEKFYVTIINGKWKTFNPEDIGDVTIS